MGCSRPIPSPQGWDKTEPARANQPNDAPGEQGVDGGTRLPPVSVCLSLRSPTGVAAPATNTGCENINNHHYNSPFIFFQRENKPAWFAAGSHLGKHLESVLLPRRAARGSEDTSPHDREEEEEEGADCPVLQGRGAASFCAASATWPQVSKAPSPQV